MNQLAEGVYYAAPPDPTARHKSVRLFKLVLGCGYVGKSMACRFHFGVDFPYLIQVEVFGYYIGAYR